MKKEKNRGCILSFFFQHKQRGEETREKVFLLLINNSEASQVFTYICKYFVSFSRKRRKRKRWILVNMHNICRLNNVATVFYSSKCNKCFFRETKINNLTDFVENSSSLRDMPNIFLLVNF